ncbi:hypothetical protein GH714_030696 [Hevea brasiliensis]|uniref:Peptidase M50 domain-containing protein n=1 Tax=Hevea brasiliensis TaxID=3981 RepID=A0A6A6N9A2_HEVBR|nr:hypothetical protein GH714_030696 [Hevea brasiliensis]
MERHSFELEFPGYVEYERKIQKTSLYIRPQFFYNNPLLSFIQYVIGPYTDDLGNVLPYAVEGVGVPVDPLAFAGLSGMVVTSLNLLPCGRLEGGRIAQAMFGRSTATLLSFATSLLLGIGGLSEVCCVWRGDYLQPSFEWRNYLLKMR